MAQKRNRQAFEADSQRHESPFVVYGTPLPPIDDHARDDGSYVPAWKQGVTDAQGRKRLHGAFTGGFSAGYYNTVGSKEGWAPATFVSSRSNRMKDNKNQSQQKAEDFMDEEDIKEAEESRHLSTNDGFQGFGMVDDPSRGDAMIGLLRPAEDSMGVKLLNKMGWKQGQGIGPRVKRKVDVDDPTSETHLFAPPDVPMISFVKKSDFKGLGFNNEVNTARPEKSVPTTSMRRTSDESEDEAGDRPGLSFGSRMKKPKKPQKGGLGVGILNDTGSDDDDPYSMGPKISYNKTLGGDKKSKKKVSSIGMANPLLKKKPLFVSKKLSSMQSVLRKCHDGRLPLAGFVLADELDTFSSMSLTDEEYKPPQVPDGWRPSRAPAGPEGDAPTQPADYQTSSALAKSSTHTHTSRASALGETPLPGKSVFDYLNPSARDRLIKATGKTNLPLARGETLAGTAQSNNAQSWTERIPHLDSHTASQALARSSIGGFMPYAEDPSKRQRYKIFLETSAAPTDTPFPKPPGTTTEDFINELNEFVRAAEVFRPVSDGLGSRFTSSTSLSVNPTRDTTETLVSRPQAKPEDPAEVAAKVGMFGPLTRTILTFAPTRLVAKRFGVEYVGAQGGGAGAGAGAGTGGVQSRSYDNRQGTDHLAPAHAPTRDESAHASTVVEPSSSTNAPRSLIEDVDALVSSVTNTVDDTDAVDVDKNEALEKERPGLAVFRAIFGSDDDDEDE